MAVLIQSRQRVLVTAVAALMGPVFMLGPTAVGVLIFLRAGPDLLSALFVPLMLGVSGFIAYHMLQNFHWVEFDGAQIRGRRFWTRQLVVQSIHDVVAIRPLGAVVQNTGTLIADKLLGSVRGYEICFRDGPGIVLVRHDMTNVDELVQAIEQSVEALRA